MKKEGKKKISGLKIKRFRSKNIKYKDKFLEALSSKKLNLNQGYPINIYSDPRRFSKCGKVEVDINNGKILVPDIEIIRKKRGHKK
ncbi:MAG: hypothetical protein ACP5OG_00720 [Candidatus Nanoarchaeia archaeon]